MSGLSMSKAPEHQREELLGYKLWSIIFHAEARDLML
jgi:hypothetical protein